MPDTHNFIARQFRAPLVADIDRDRYSNALMRNQVDQLPQQNQMQDLAIQSAEQNLRAGDMEIGEAQRRNAAGVVMNRLAAVASSQNPVIAYQQFIRDPGFQSAGKIAGLPVEKFTFDPNTDTADSIRAGATDWARAIGAQIESPKPGYGDAIEGPDGSVLQRGPDGQLHAVLQRQPRESSQAAPDREIVSVLDPETGKAIYMPRSQAAGREPAPTNQNLRPIPASAAKGIIENRANITQIDRAIAAVQGNIEAVKSGRDEAAFGAWNYVGDTIRQRSNPTGVGARALVADIGSLKIHDRSGAAVTAAETPRLKPFIPAATDEPGVIITKLQNFKAQLESQVDETESFYSPESGYRPLQPGAQSSAPTVTATGPNGEKIGLVNGQWVPLNASQ